MAPQIARRALLIASSHWIMTALARSHSLLPSCEAYRRLIEKGLDAKAKGKPKRRPSIS